MYILIDKIGKVIVCGSEETHKTAISSSNGSLRAMGSGERLYADESGELHVAVEGSQPSNLSEVPDDWDKIQGTPDGSGGWIMYTPKPIPAEVFEPHKPVKVVDAWAAKAAISEAGLLDAIKGYVQKQIDAGNHIFQAKWDGALTFRSSDSDLMEASKALGINGEQIDALFKRDAAIVSAQK